jgi:hypothetical protein
MYTEFLETEGPEFDVWGHLGSPLRTPHLSRVDFHTLNSDLFDVIGVSTHF